MYGKQEEFFESNIMKSDVRIQPQYLGHRTSRGESDVGGQKTIFVSSGNLKTKAIIFWLPDDGKVTKYNVTGLLYIKCNKTNIKTSDYQRHGASIFG